MKEKFLLDIDGTLMSGSEAVNGSIEFISCLKQQNIEFLAATNSIKSPEVQRERLLRAGLDLREDQFFSPLDAINGYISSRNIKSVFVAGSEAEKKQIRAEESSDSPELVVLLDFEKNNCSYNELQFLFELLERGCPAVSASGSGFYLNKGKKQLDTGAFVSLLESVTGSAIPVLGKPSPGYFKQAAARLGRGTITAVGDDYLTDITGAHNAGFSTVLIRSGKYNRGDELKCSPGRVIDSLGELTEN